MLNSKKTSFKELLYYYQGKIIKINFVWSGRYVSANVGRSLIKTFFRHANLGGMPWEGKERGEGYIYRGPPMKRSTFQKMRRTTFLFMRR